MAWTIKGETGKTLSATSRTLEALSISSASVVFASLADDVLTWTAATNDSAGGGTIVPDVGQIVELYWNTTRKFRGHVMAPEVGIQTVTVKAMGPWWWMTRTPLTQDQEDSTGTVAERFSYVFKQQNLATSIANLINRAIANGAPLKRGLTSAMYAAPQITLNSRDCGAALAELMRRCPDAVAWFDYSTDLPTLHIQRRGPSTPLTIAIPGSNVEKMSIKPRLDLEVTRCELKYVTRNSTTGKPKWASQSNGTNVVGKRQIITVSGPEIVDFLPSDDFAAYEIQTAASVSAFVNAREPGLVSARAEYGSTVSVAAGSGNSVTAWKSASKKNGATRFSPDKEYGTSTWYYPPPSFISTRGGRVNLSGKYMILSDRPPEWVLAMFGGALVEGTLSGSLYTGFVTDANGGTATETKTIPSWVFAMGMTKSVDGWQGEGVGCYQFEQYVRQFEMPAWLVTTAYPTKTNLYKPWQYDYQVPPADLAENLKSAQNWVPWQGPITTVMDEVTAASNLLGRSVNVTGTIAACATMKALLKSITYDIKLGRTTYDLGAPARTDFGSLVARVRSEPSDNIKFL